MHLQRKVAVLSEGCAANFGDGEEIGERFAREGFAVQFEMPSDTPDAIVLNACTVKGITSATKLAKKIRSQFENVPVWVTGCATDDLKRALVQLFPDFCFGPKDAHKNESAFQEFAHKLSATNSKVQEIPDLQSHAGIGLVNIEEGCLDACSYCSTRLVKGVLKSAAPDSIVRRVQRKVEAGAKEIFLTGQDTSCYGFDLHTNLAALLQQIIVHVPGDYKIRLGMGNPRHVLRYLEALLESFEDEHLYKFVHIPVQSGSDRILKAMNRRHTHKEYLQIAKAFRTRFPEMTLGTDIIVAFPGETREDFEESVRLVKETRPSICNITRFVPREGTPAFALKNGVLKEERYARSAELAQVFQQIALENNRSCIGKVERVTVEKVGMRAGTTIARDDAYRPVALQGNFPIGQTLDVKIRDAETFALLAEPLI